MVGWCREEEQEGLNAVILRGKHGIMRGRILTEAISARRCAGREPSVERKKERLGRKGSAHPPARQAASASLSCCWVYWGQRGWVRRGAAHAYMYVRWCR